MLDKLLNITYWRFQLIFCDQTDEVFLETHKYCSADIYGVSYHITLSKYNGYITEEFITYVFEVNLLLL